MNSRAEPIATVVRASPAEVGPGGSTHPLFRKARTSVAFLTKPGCQRSDVGMQHGYSIPERYEASTDAVLVAPLQCCNIIATIGHGSQA